MEVLKKCTEKLEVPEFAVETVVCLTKKENPRSKSWKVAVPARLKGVMVNPAMFPRGWSHRVFHAGRPRQQEGTVTLGASAAAEVMEVSV